jgi:hypothetical protein
LVRSFQQEILAKLISHQSIHFSTNARSNT